MATESEIFFKEVSAERLTARLEAVFTKEAEEETVKHPHWSSHYHASSLSECLRKGTYSQLHILPTRTVGKRSWQLSATIGNLIHDQIQSDLKDDGALLYVHPTFGPAVEIPLEKVLDPDLAEDYKACHVSGRIDMVMDLGGSLYIGDVKTVGSADMRDPKDMTARERGYFLDKMLKWQTQLALYLHFFKSSDGRKADHGFIYLIDRGSPQTRKQFQLPRDASMIEPDLVRLREATKYLKRGELPIPEPERKSCTFCGYLSICKPFWPAKDTAVAEEESAD